MRIVVAPDSFKGSLSAAEAADSIEAGVMAALPDAIVIKVPLADGGEGTVDALVGATGGRKLAELVTGPLGDSVRAVYGILGDGETAVIEMAAASGLSLIPPEKRNPLITTSYGTGELIKAALGHSVKRMIVGVGGSATNDGGAGAMQALGVRFLDRDGQELPRGGAALRDLCNVDISGLVFPVGKVEMKVACDVTNALLGTEGASAVYGPQKGATPGMVAVLDDALERYAQVVHRYLYKDIAGLRAGGAAGGLAAGLAGFLDAELVGGADLVLEMVGFDKALAGADLVVTGEGRIDRQTLYGKTISGVLEHARAVGAPVVAVAGLLGEGIEALRFAGLEAAFSMSRPGMLEEHAMRQAATLLEKAARRAVTWWNDAGDS